MAGMPWVKVYTEVLDDPKLAKISEGAKWRFVQLILVAAECDAGGAFVVGDDVMTNDEIAWRLRICKESLEKDITELVKNGLLTIDGKVLEITKFADRQGPTQKERRETWKSRQQKRRERVTRDSRNKEENCHALEEEKSREEKEEIREEEEQTLPPMKNNYLLYTQEVGSLTPSIADFIDLYESELSPEWVHDAILETSAHGARVWSYTKTVLDTWKIKGRMPKSVLGGKKSNAESNIDLMNKLLEQP